MRTARDGSPVELYARMPSFGEPELIHVHVAPDGVVLIQRYDPEWAANPRPTNAERDGIRISVLDPRRDGRTLTATAEYEVDGQVWRHGPSTATILDEDELADDLAAAGLRVDRWLDERRTWLAAAPIGGSAIGTIGTNG